MNIGLTRRVAMPFDRTVPLVREALKEQGFGILTEIDVQATLRDKLGEPMEDYLILGACNPPLAHQALTVDRQIGMLLPCNVVVRRDQDETVVEALDPDVMVRVTGNTDLEPVAEDAARRLRVALERLPAE